jgi:hypothetical protein
VLFIDTPIQVLIYYVEGGMDNLTFGMTMIVIGMGGTLLALSLFAILMNVLKMLFPYREEKDK